MLRARYTVAAVANSRLNLTGCSWNMRLRKGTSRKVQVVITVQK
jgi:hypothetical protein